jgi:asparagine synthetase B (glutamine-hydrolysing)
LVLAEVPDHESDTDLVAKLLQEAIQSTENALLSQTDTDATPGTSLLLIIAQVMSRLVNAEYAFCLLTPNAVYFGRDLLGRRSLLTSQDPAGEACFQLCSVATDMTKNWSELRPGLVHEYNRSTHEIQTAPIQPLALLPKQSHTPTLKPPPPPPQVSATMWQASLELEALLTRAVQRRLVSCHSSKPIGILFSGGLDSVVLAGIALKLLSTQQRLELYNVAFGDSSKEGSNSTMAADRLAALQCYQELESLATELGKKHVPRLVLVNVQNWESVVEQEGRVQQLIYPKTSVMDLNIGTALWFASQGLGNDREQTTTTNMYQGEAKILLLGMGADEQMGGYGRHRNAWVKGSLRREMDLDIGRIWERNLGRDDRIVSDHGKEARFPFLDPHVMDFLASTPIEDICDFSLPPGQGDKRILRLVAQRMGLITASGLVKRAIQFGSRIAHLSDKQRFGSRRQAKGDAHY